MLEKIIPKTGDRIGRYELLDELGRGGFGVVFRARQSGLEMDVAIKIMIPQGDALKDPGQWTARFEQETRVLRQLRHSATIRILDSGKTEMGLPFFALEFAKGQPLSTVMGSGPLAESRVQRIADQVLGSLAEAHHHGIVHRDLKPDNVMVVDVVGDEDAIKVLDFGIAKVMGDDEAVVTRTGMAFGTPRYMAPEQLRDTKAIDGRTDLYTLGLIIAEAVSGAPVVDAPSLEMQWLTHLSSEPLAFSTAVQQSALYPVIQRATAKDPAARFQDAAQMRNALRAVQPRTAAPGSVAPVSPSPQATAPRHPNTTPSAPVFAAPQGTSWTAHGGETQPHIHQAPPRPAAVPAATGPAPSKVLAIVALSVAVIAAAIVLLVSQLGGDEPDQAADATARVELPPLPEDISELEAVCEEGRQDGCVEFGLRIARGAGIYPDPPRAQRLFRAACDADEPQGCLHLGRLLVADSSEIEAVSEGEALIVAACDDGVVGGCYALARHRINEGEWHYTGSRVAEHTRSDCAAGHGDACVTLGTTLTGGERPTDQALELFRRACELGSQRCSTGLYAMARFNVDGTLELAETMCNESTSVGCGGMAFWHLFRSTGASADQFLDWWQRGCQAGDLDACFRVGDYLQRTAERPADAIAPYTRACTGGYSQACLQLGGLYERGSGVEQDMDHALELFRTACDRRHGWACWVLASRESPDLRPGLLERACGYQGSLGCFELGQHREAEGDRDAAIAAYLEACEDGNHSDACLALGLLESTGDTAQIDHEAAFGHFMSGCSYGNGDACAGAVRSYYAGDLEYVIDTEVDLLAPLESACNQRTALACQGAAVVYETGYGVPPATQPERAAQLLQRACDLGESDACEAGGLVPEGDNAE